jgi:hypothetical protein
LGCNLSSDQSSYKESIPREACEISNSEVGNSEQIDKEEGNKEKILPIHNKSNTKTTNNDASNGKDVSIGSSNIKGETDANIQVGAYCFNRERIEKMQPPLGRLRRISPMGRITWSKCKFVHPHNSSKGCVNKESMLKMLEGNGIDSFCMSNEDSQNSTMIVEIIDNKYDRDRIATFLRLKFDEESECTDDLDDICEFGFTHIIIIQFGPMFLDCYGRVFKLNLMTGVLWFYGNSLKEAAEDRWSQSKAWIVEEDKSIYEFENCKYANLDSFLQ